MALQFTRILLIASLSKLRIIYMNLRSHHLQTIKGIATWGNIGVMYLLVVEYPSIVDVLGSVVHREFHFKDEVPPMPVLDNIKLINSIGE